MSLIVLGTDTDVGKTVVSAIMVARYSQRFKLAYWKPVATGSSDETDRERVVRWVGQLADILPESYLFEPPVSPHLAARLAGEKIEVDRLLEDLVRYGFEDQKRRLLIEGIGGLLVPLTDSGFFFSDLVRELHLPVVLVARSAVGTINHTLLTLEALRSRDIKLAGIVLNGEPNPDNRDAIERFGAAEIVAEVPHLDELSPEAIAKAAKSFDTQERLDAYFE